MRKFDVVVGTPPYTRKNVIKYTNKFYDISKEWVVIFHQSMWLTNKRNVEKYNKFKDKIGNSIQYLKFLNGSPIFNATISSPLVIDVMNKNKTHPEIIVDDIINNSHLEYDNIYEINSWNDVEIYPELEKKIKKLVSEYGSYSDHADYTWEYKNKAEKNLGKYYVTFREFKGTIDYKNIDNIYSKSFYSLLDKNEEVTTIENRKSKVRIYFAFNSRYFRKSKFTSRTPMGRKRFLFPS